MATDKSAKIKEIQYSWEGKDKAGKVVKGETRGAGEASVSAHLRRQGIQYKDQEQIGRRSSHREGHHAIYTPTCDHAEIRRTLTASLRYRRQRPRQPCSWRLLLDIKTDVETGSSLEQSFRKFPLYFDDLYCNLIGAGEAAGILDSLLDRLATYKEKIQAIKSKIKSALFYPVSIIIIAFVITAVIMIFVIQAFKELFTSSAPTCPPQPW